jgi:hypothetical protein
MTRRRRPRNPAGGARSAGRTSLALPRFRRLRARTAPLVLPFVPTPAMSGILSATSAVNAPGFTAEVLRDWPVARRMSWLVAFPTMLAAPPAVRRRVATMPMKR